MARGNQHRRQHTHTPARERRDDYYGKWGGMSMEAKCDTPSCLLRRHHGGDHEHY